MSRETTAIARFRIPLPPFFASDNRSSFNGLMLHLQGNMRRFNLVANYTLSKLRPGVACSANSSTMWTASAPRRADRTKGSSMLSDPATTAPPAKMFAIALCSPVRCTIPGGFELSTITQVESARPITITTQDNSGRISVSLDHGPDTYTSLDEFVAALTSSRTCALTRPINIMSAGESNPSSNSSISLTAITLERIMRSTSPRFRRL